MSFYESEILHAESQFPFCSVFSYHDIISWISMTCRMLIALKISQHFSMLSVPFFLSARKMSIELIKKRKKNLLGRPLLFKKFFPVTIDTNRFFTSQLTSKSFDSLLTLTVESQDDVTTVPPLEQHILVTIENEKKKKKIISF